MGNQSKGPAGKGRRKVGMVWSVGQAAPLPRGGVWYPPRPPCGCGVGWVVWAYGIRLLCGVGWCHIRFCHIHLCFIRMATIACFIFKLST